MNTKTERPKGWPETLKVFDNGGGWSGLAVDPNNNPVDHVKMFLDSMDDHDNDPSEMLEQTEDWTLVDWDEERGCYAGSRYYTADGKHRRCEVGWSVDDLAFF